MTERANERIAFFNGEYLPESRVLIPFRDRSFRWGDGVFDTERTIAGRIFRLEQHVDRLFRSLRYLDIDCGMSPAEIAEATEETVRRNEHLRPENEDWWVFQRISRGVDWVGDEPNRRDGANVIVEVLPLPLRDRATLFRDGIELVIAPGQRTGPEAQSPRAKMASYINLDVAERAVKRQNPMAWALMLDRDGKLNEGKGQNMFLVQDGVVRTPPGRMVLEGVSRAVVLELCEAEGIAVEEAELDQFDAYTADEAFLSSTSLCVCPVGSIDGRRMAAGTVPGPVTRRVMDAYRRLVDFDFEDQYLQFLDG